MSLTTDTTHKCFQLLQDVLLDAFHISALYLAPPYTDFDKIDNGIRAAVWPDYRTEGSEKPFVNASQTHRLLSVRSNLGFYNVILILNPNPTLNMQQEFISIGPFRDNELSADYFAQILRESHISPTDIQRIRHIYETMPYAQLDSVINVTRHIVGLFLPEFNELEPRLVQYSEEKRAVEIQTEILERNTIESSARYQDYLFQFLEELKTGDNIKAKKAMQVFLHESKLLGNRNLKDYKTALLLLNDYCHTALMQTSIHPYHILKQAGSIRVKIADMTSLARLEQMPSEICHKYCLLVKNYANPDYSRLTKEIITYIQLHLEEDLSLNNLAGHFHKNPSALSYSFSKETGQTLTSFVHQTRIQEALRLFNTTDMSVSQVATAVGYQDFSYFSKVFSKHVGVSPREYKRGR